MGGCQATTTVINCLTKEIWTPAKSAWCCKTKGIGCTTSPPYDCNAGYFNWNAGWSVGKKQWCCLHAQKGCPATATTSLPYDCNEGYLNWKAGWAVGKKNWCCLHEQ